uniref:Uncharacterized protein n=1 Tax=Rhizophora mucronata TaxID=61149 RepID=A0A2P2MM55_RHIMU
MLRLDILQLFKTLLGERRKEHKQEVPAQCHILVTLLRLRGSFLARQCCGNSTSYKPHSSCSDTHSNNTISSNSVFNSLLQNQGLPPVWRNLQTFLHQLPAP